MGWRGVVGSGGDGGRGGVGLIGGGVGWGAALRATFCQHSYGTKSNRGGCGDFISTSHY